MEIDVNIIGILEWKRAAHKISYQGNSYKRLIFVASRIINCNYSDIRSEQHQIAAKDRGFAQTIRWRIQPRFAALPVAQTLERLYE